VKQKAVLAVLALVSLTGCGATKAQQNSSTAGNSQVSVTVSSPTNGSTVSSPVTFVASATSAQAITGWFIDVDSVNVYQGSQGSTLKASVTMASGAHSVTVRAAHSQGVSGSATLTLQVSGSTGVTPIALTTNSLPNGTVGAGYSANLTASGGTPPYKWSVVSGQLPAGLNLSSGGTISGTPAAAGSFAFTLQVKDSGTSPQAATAAQTITIANGAPGPTPTPTPSSSSLSVQVSGNHLVNQSGQTIHLIGFGHQGSEYMCLTSNQTFDDPNSLTTTPQNMKAWGAGVNIARIPLNEDCWLGINGVVQGGAAYQNDIVSFVNNLHKSGMYAELELHWNAPGSSQATDQQVMPDFDHSIAFWQSVANTFKNDPAVTFNLYNEPHDVTWPCWQNGGSNCVFGFRIAGMEEMIQAIRAVEGSGWHHPIVVAGLGWSNDLSGWLANRPADSANQIIAGIHTYDDGAGGSGGCPADPGGPWNENNCATNIFGGIKAAGFPMMVTEMGDLSAGGCTYSSYLDSAFKWLDANADGYEPWAWGPYGCSNPSLLTDWNGTPQSTYGSGTKAHMQSLPTTY
jgi:endoglucanase